MKQIKIEIVMNIEDTDCLAIEEIGDDLSRYGDIISISYESEEYII